MPKLENYIDHFKIDGVPYSRNSLNYRIIDNEVNVWFKGQLPLDRIQKSHIRGFYNQWTDKNDNTYSSLSALEADLELFLFTGAGDFHTEVALNRRQGSTTWNKFGYNDDIDIGTELIASWGGTFQFITTGETIDIVSTSSDDSSGGTGVNSIVLYGVDESWDEQIEVVTMNGTNTVTTSTQWIGINRVAVFLAGTGRTNAGTINVTANTSGYQMAQMPQGESVSQQMIFYTYGNHNFLAQWLYFNAIKTSGGGNPEIIFKGWVYSAVNNAKQEVYRGKLDTQQGNYLDVSPPVPFPISQKTILWFEATTNTNNTQVSGRISGELIKDIGL